MNGTAREFARFCLVGALGFVVATAILYATIALGAGFYAGYAISFVLTVTVTWWLNRLYTFDNRGAGKLRQWARFAASNAVGGMFNYGAYAALISTLAAAREHPVIATAVGSLAGLAVNFLAAKRLVFALRSSGDRKIEPPPLRDRFRALRLSARRAQHR